MQSNRFLGKRSSFSNFSPYRPNPSPAYEEYNQHQLQLQQQQQQRALQLQQQQQQQMGAVSQNPSNEDQLHFGGGKSYSSSYGPPQVYPSGGQAQPQGQQPQQAQQSQSHSMPLNGTKSTSSSPGYSAYPYQFTTHQTQQLSTQPQVQSQQQHMPSIQASVPKAHFESHWPLYSVDWAHCGPSDLNIIAVSTYTEDLSNKIQVVQAYPSVQPSTGLVLPKSLDFFPPVDFTVPYPCTKLAWAPASYQATSSTMPLITTGDCLRLWNYNADTRHLSQRCALVNKAKSSYMPPITNFDWNSVDPSIVITSSIDTTCTIWDIASSTARTQLIAHDSEVYDVAFVYNSTDIFGSVGADGSVRMFDQRALDHSTIIYDPPNPVPLVKIEANPRDPNSLAILASETNDIYLLDIRMPGGPVASLKGHQRAVNTIRWAPPSAVPRPGGSSPGSSTGSPGSRNSPAIRSFRHVLVSGSDDCQAIIWDASTTVQFPVPAGSTTSTSQLGASGNGKSSSGQENYSLLAAYTHNHEVNGVTWSRDGSWIGLAAGRGLQAVSL